MLTLNIRQKVVITTVTAVLTAIAIISVFSLNSSREIILEGTVDRELPAILGEVANDLDAQLIRPITVAKAMATNPDYIHFLEQNEPTGERQKVATFLAEINNTFGTFTSFLVSVSNGLYYTHDGLFKTISQSDPRDQWFYNFINSKKEFGLALDVDEKAKVPTLFINHLISNNGKPLAVTGVGLTLDSMSKSISQYTIRDNGFVYLADQNGIIKIHPDVSLVGKNISTLGDLNTQSLLNEQKFSITEYENKGVNLIAASRYLPEIGWYVIAQTPSDEVFSAISDATWAIVIMGLVISVIFMLISTWLVNHLISPFGEIAKMLEKIGDGGGDLTQRLDESRPDETGQMARGYNNFVDYLAQLLKNISDTGNALYSSIERIDYQAKDMAQEITQQASEIDQIATAIHQMGATAEEIAERANHAAENAQIASSAVSDGDASVQKTVQSVSGMSQQLQTTSDTILQLANDGESIGDVLEVIRGISEQTNLLALNAAIEAARAGEQGRGFSVVADEVRTLASRSHASTEEIRQIIEQLQNKTGELVHAISESTTLSSESQNEADNSGQQLANIASNIASMNELNLQIASATSEQSNVVNEINPHVVSIATISRNNSSIVQQTSIDCSALKDMASELNKLVSRFQF